MSAAQSEADLMYLRNKEKQLRDEKKQLRDDIKQLRDEKKQLREDKKQLRRGGYYEDDFNPGGTKKPTQRARGRLCISVCFVAVHDIPLF